MANVYILHTKNQSTLQVETPNHDVNFEGRDKGVTLYVGNESSQGVYLSPRDIDRVIRFLEEYTNG